MKEKKFEQLEVEKIYNTFKDSNLDLLKLIDQTKQSIPDKDVALFTSKNMTGHHTEDYCRSIMAVGALESITNKVSYKNTQLYPSVLLSVYRSLKQKHVFNFTEDIFFKLMNTQIKKVDLSFLKMPFDTVNFVLPNNSVEISDNIKLTFKEIVLTNVNSENKIIIQSFGEADCNGSKIIEQSGIVLNLNCNTVEEMFDNTTEILKNVRVREKSETSIEDDIKVYRFYFNFTINALLYINSIETFETVKAKYYIAKKRNGKANQLKEKTKVKEKNKDLSKINRIIIGSNVSLSDEERETLSSIKTMINCPKWLVRGHWRSQPCGIMNTDRKLIWIEPYTKGKGMAEELVSKDYLVK